ncbi:A disintegrin and metalloproteinase with thrombospondin motifs 7 isoform X1 [Biomphalaria glabrata]|nr:A disintegrin and metalloproteinase with thrombospondin motifs 7 isoform X1 [Biomphalaria glabrata]
MKLKLRKLRLGKVFIVKNSLGLLYIVPTNRTLTGPLVCQFAQDLSHFHISWPSRVNHVGEHISHDLHAKSPQLPRARRSADGQDSMDISPAAHEADTSAHHGVLHYKIPLHKDKDVVVQLKRSSALLAPSAILERRSKNVSDSSFIRLSHHNGCHFTGTVTGVAYSKVALSACNGLVST